MMINTKLLLCLLYTDAQLSLLVYLHFVSNKPEQLIVRGAIGENKTWRSDWVAPIKFYFCSGHVKPMKIP